MIGVKGLARDIALARHSLLVRDIVDLRIAWHVHFALVVLEQLPKHLCRGDELFRGVLLITNHQHVMIGKGAVQRSPGLAIDAAIQVDASYFGAGMRGQWSDRVSHRRLLCRFRAWRQVWGPASRFCNLRPTTG